MLFGLFGLVIGVFVVAAIALGAAFLLKVVASGTSWRWRAFWAAIIAGFLPMVVPVIAILSKGSGPDTVPALASMAFGGAILALLIGFPIGYLVNRPRGDKPPPDPSVFE